MSIPKSDPLNEEPSVIGSLIARSQNLMGSNEAETCAPSSGYEMTSNKNKMMMKSRRGRTSFTPSQVSDLEAAFANSHYPDFQTRKDLSSCLKIPDDRIQVWFQNRRAKWRKTQRQLSNGQAPIHGYHGNRFQATQAIPLYQESTATTTGSYTMTPTRSYNSALVKEEATGFITTPSSAENKEQQYQSNQGQLINIYDKLTVPHTTQELVSENQRVAPSLYSLSTTITSSGQYIILGGNPQTSMVQNYPPHVPSTSTLTKYEM